MAIGRGGRRDHFAIGVQRSEFDEHRCHRSEEVREDADFRGENQRRWRGYSSMFEPRALVLERFPWRPHHPSGRQQDLWRHMSSTWGRHVRRHRSSTGSDDFCIAERTHRNTQLSSAPSSSSPVRLATVLRRLNGERCRQRLNRLASVFVANAEAPGGVQRAIARARAPNDKRRSEECDCCASAPCDSRLVQLLGFLSSDMGGRVRAMSTRSSARR